MHKLEFISCDVHAQLKHMHDQLIVVHDIFVWTRYTGIHKYDIHI